MTARTFYEVLGVAHDADVAVIKSHWRSALLRTHPDQQGDPGEMLAVQAAWETLRDPDLRAAYDRKLKGLPHTKPKLSDGRDEVLAVCLDLLHDLMQQLGVAGNLLWVDVATQAVEGICGIVFRAIDSIPRGSQAITDWAELGEARVPWERSLVDILHSAGADRKIRADVEAFSDLIFAELIEWADQRVRGFGGRTRNAGPLPRRPRCEGTTAKGDNCWNTPTTGQRYCWLHSPKPTRRATPTVTAPNDKAATRGQCYMSDPWGHPCRGTVVAAGLCKGHLHQGQPNPASSRTDERPPERDRPQPRPASKASPETASATAGCIGILVFIGIVIGAIALVANFVMSKLTDDDPTTKPATPAELLQACTDKILTFTEPMGEAATLDQLDLLLSDTDTVDRLSEIVSECGKVDTLAGDGGQKIRSALIEVANETDRLLECISSNEPNPSLPCEDRLIDYLETVTALGEAADDDKALADYLLS